MKESNADKKPATRNKNLYEQFCKTIPLINEVFKYTFPQEEYTGPEPHNPSLTNPLKTLEDFSTLTIQLQTSLLAANDSVTLKKMYKELYALFDWSYRLMRKETKEIHKSLVRGNPKTRDVTITGADETLQDIADISNVFILFLQELNSPIATYPKLHAKNQEWLVDLILLKENSERLKLNDLNGLCAEETEGTEELEETEEETVAQITNQQELKYSNLIWTEYNWNKTNNTKSPPRETPQITPPTPASLSVAELKEQPLKRKELPSSESLMWLKKLKEIHKTDPTTTSLQQTSTPKTSSEETEKADIALRSLW